MTADISDQLHAAARGRGPRGNPRQSLLLANANSVLPGEIDWDDDAGEDWARIINNDDVFAYVATELPLILVLRDFADAVSAAVVDAEIVVVADMAAKGLSATAESLTAAFGEVVREPSFLHSEFSADELWFFTI